jgi:hypothetical protein
MRYRFVLLLPIVAGCADQSPPSTALVRDSAGIRIVENFAPLWQEGQEWHLSPQPVVDIGGGGSQEHDLFRAWSPVRLSDGRIVVANGGSRELRFYTGDGAFVRSVGRRGDGPGEFQGLRWVRRLRGDSLITFDFRQMRFAVFDSSGAFARGFRLLSTTEVPFASILDMFADGSFLAQGFANTGGKSPSGLQRYGSPLYHFGPDGTLLTDLGMFGGNEVYYVALAGGGFRAHEPFFPLYTYRVAAGDRLYIAANDTYELRGHTLDGKLVNLVRVVRPPVAVTEEHLRLDGERRMAQAGSDERRRAMSSVLDEIPVPETFPAYQKVLIDEEINIWVREYTLPGAAQATWAVFDSTGVLLGRLAAALRFEPYDIGSNYVLGLWRDADDVEHVRMYELVKL